MKVTIEIWESSFNSEWNCDITTRSTHSDETEYWSLENFTDLLKLLGDKFPKAKVYADNHEGC